MDLNLSGRRAVIMGGSDGLGYATARALAGEGVQVCLLARNAERLKAACRNIEAETDTTATPVMTDLTHAQAVQDAIAEITSCCGMPDILVCNGGGPPPNRADATAPSAWPDQFASLLYPTLQMVDAFLPHMRAQNFGRIIMIASVSVVRPLAGMAFSNSLRSALASWGQTLALEVAPQGITVNTLMPGLFDTARVRALNAARQGDGAASQSMSFLDPALIPAGRLGKPEELGAHAAYLASPLAAYITGAMIPIDGGMLVKG